MCFLDIGFIIHSCWEQEIGLESENWENLHKEDGISDGYERISRI